MSADNFKKLILQIRDNHLERLDGSVFEEEERNLELLQELKGNKSVKVVNCYLGPRFCGVFSDVLKVNNTIKKVDLWGNNLGDQDARSISEALKANKSLKELRLGRNNFSSEGARAFADALKVNQVVKCIFLGCNSIGSEGARAIADALKVNQTIEMISVADNNIDSEGAQAIADALKVNQRLTVLYLWGNKFDTGAQVLLDAIKMNGSLTNCRVNDFQDETNVCCKRNVAMHERAEESVVHLLALRQMRRIIWIPKEMMVMIGQMLWKTKSDVEAWNKH